MKNYLHTILSTTSLHYGQSDAFTESLLRGRVLLFDEGAHLVDALVHEVALALGLVQRKGRVRVRGRQVLRRRRLVGAGGAAADAPLKGRRRPLRRRRSAQFGGAQVLFAGLHHGGLVLPVQDVFQAVRPTRRRPRQRGARRRWRLLLLDFSHSARTELGTGGRTTFHVAQPDNITQKCQKLDWRKVFII